MSVDWLVAKVSDQERHLRERREQVAAAKRSLAQLEQRQVGAQHHYDYWKQRLIDAILKDQQL